MCVGMGDTKQASNSLKPKDQIDYLKLVLTTRFRGSWEAKPITRVLWGL